MKMGKDYMNLQKFMTIYAMGSLLVLFWITAESVFIKKLTFSYLWQFSLPATGIILVLHMAVMLGFTYLRLRVYGDRSSKPDDIRRRLLRFPREAYIVLIVFGAFFIPVYHVVHYGVEGHSFIDVPLSYRINFLGSYLYELSIVLCVAVFYYASIRRTIRPMLVQLGTDQHGRMPHKSFVRILFVDFTSLLLMTVLILVWYVLKIESLGQPVSMGLLISLVVVDFVFSLVIFLLLTLEYRKDLREMITALQAVTLEDTTPSKMPILTNDEVGRLASVMNQLHDRLSEEYNQIQNQYELARNVQRLLLPSLHEPIGPYHAQALSVPRRSIGSGFYDVIEMQHGRYAFLIGDVGNEGLPGALNMSAALVTMRSELRSPGDVQSILKRIHHQLEHPLSDTAMALAVVIMNPSQGTFQSLLVGDARVALVGNGEIQALKSSLHDEIPLVTWDRMDLYTAALDPFFTETGHSIEPGGCSFTACSDWIEATQHDAYHPTDFILLRIGLTGGLNA